MAQEQLQEVELNPGQLEGAFAALALARREVEAQVAHAQQAALALEAPPQQGAQPGQQLGQGVGLHQVVVRTGVEPLDPVVDRIARRQHQHRGVVARAAHAPAHREPVEVGQTKVEDQRVGRGLGQGFERLASRGNRHDVVALEAQGTVNGAADRRVVVDHQNAHEHRTYRRASRRARPRRVSNL